MQFLKALVIHLPSTTVDVLDASFDAPGWRVQYVIVDGSEGLQHVEVPCEAFDWVIIEHAECDDTLNDQIFEILIEKNLLNRNNGIIQVKVNNPNVDESLHHLFWRNLAQCLYSAYFAPESNTTPVQEIYQNYQLSGHIRLQTPLFARTASLVLSNISLNPERINLGLWEMLINGVEHGNLGITHEEKRNHVETDNMDELVQQRLSLASNQDKYVMVKFNIDAAHAFFDITDQGEGFDWNKYWEIDATRLFDKNGRGIALARMAGFDCVEYLGTGNHVKCTIYFVEN